MILIILASLMIEPEVSPLLLSRGYDCATINHHIKTLREQTVIDMARAKGIPGHVMAEAAKRCQRKQK